MKNYKIYLLIMLISFSMTVLFAINVFLLSSDGINMTRIEIQEMLLNWFFGSLIVFILSGTGFIIKYKE